ncbi:MAG TPA: hypoxanthine phosphoribosyltransferase [Methanocorpusculum sp.]|nr:hypoxanthine phosphoribosyltransferase [Methanocorpusculum sp.]
MLDNIDVIIPELQINLRIKELAHEIDLAYLGKPVTFIVVLKGACFFACELTKHLTIPVTIDFIQIRSYEGMCSTGVFNYKLDISPESINGRDVIIIEDVIDTGRTITEIKKHIQLYNPLSIAVCSLLDKPSCRLMPISGDYIGFSIDNVFVVGYGLDFNEKYRNLPYIGILKNESGK